MWLWYDKWNIKWKNTGKIIKRKIAWLFGSVFQKSWKLTRMTFKYSSLKSRSGYLIKICYLFFSIWNHFSLWFKYVSAPVIWFWCIMIKVYIHLDSYMNNDKMIFVYEFRHLNSWGCGSTHKGCELFLICGYFSSLYTSLAVHCHCSIDFLYLEQTSLHRLQLTTS